MMYISSYTRAGDENATPPDVLRVNSGNALDILHTERVTYFRRGVLTHLSPFFHSSERRADSTLSLHV